MLTRETATAVMAAPTMALPTMEVPAMPVPATEVVAPVAHPMAGEIIATAIEVVDDVSDWGSVNWVGHFVGNVHINGRNARI